jgi:hypothetical protein
MGGKVGYTQGNRIPFNFSYSVTLHTVLCMQKTLIEDIKYVVDHPQILTVHFFESNVYKHCL